MRNGLVLLFLFLVLAAVGAFVWTRDGAPVVPLPDAPRDPGSGTAAPAAPAVVDPAAVAAAERTLAAATAPTAGDELALPANAKWFDVRVVDAATKAPVPRAEVRWLPAWAWARLIALPAAARDGLVGDEEAVARRFGGSSIADGEGSARVAFDPDNQGVAVHAYANGRYGLRRISEPLAPPPGGFTVELEPDRTLRARVLTPDGAPREDVTVEVRAASANGKPVRSASVPPARSGADGLATFVHVQRWGREYGGIPADTTWRVQLQVPGLDDPGVVVDPASLPEDPVELRLPATGAILACVRHQGRALVDGVKFQAWRGATDDNDHGNRARRVSPGPDGVARIEPVALGGELVVRARVGSAHLDATVPAPHGHGEVVRAEFTTDDVLALSGILVGPDGAPVRNQRIQGECDLGMLMGGVSVETDGDGRFVWFAARAHRSMTAAVKRLVLSLPVADGAPLRVSVPPRPLERGVNDLGVLQLSAGALVVAGRIVANDATARRALFVVESLHVGAGAGRKDVWQTVEGLTPTRLPDGRFEVRGETRPQRHRLRFPGEEHLPVTPVEFALGTADLQIEIDAGHRLAATALLPRGLPRERVRGLLRPQSAPPGEPAGPRAGANRDDRHEALGFGVVDGECSLRWVGLPAGTYDLALGVLGVDAPLTTIPDVVLPQPATPDPRLAGIDLRGLARTVRLDVTIAGGEPGERLSRNVFAFVLPQVDPAKWLGLGVHDDQPLALPSGPIELLVCADGLAPQRVAVAAGQDTAAVTLSPWPLVELRFPGLPPLPSGVTLNVGLRGDEPPGARAATFRADGNSGGLLGLLHCEGHAAVANGRARVRVGDGRLQVSVWVGDASGRRLQRVAGPTPGELLAGPDLPPVEIHVPAAALQAAIAALQAAAASGPNGK